MNISDLSYQETAINATELEGGIWKYESGTVFGQHIQAVDGYTASGSGGSVSTAQVMDLCTFTYGGLNIKF